MALAHDRGLPILDDGVGGAVVWEVVWGSAAGLYKELGVVDRCGGLDLHVDPSPDLILQRVRAGVLHGLELTVGVELEAVGEGAEAFLHYRDVVSVNVEGQGHVLAFGVLAGELDLQQVLPGDHIVQTVNCADFILEVQVLRVLLQRKWIRNQPSAEIKATCMTPILTSISVPQALRGMTLMMCVLLEVSLQAVFVGSLTLS